MQIRPFIEMRVGQVNLPLRVPISPLLVDAPTTSLSVNTAAGVTSLSVLNSSIFSTYNGYGLHFPILIGEPGNQNSEIVFLSTIGDQTTINLTGGTLFPHSASTVLYPLLYNAIEISHANTVTGSKTVVIDELDITADTTTNYNDYSQTGGYYFARFWQPYVGGIVGVAINVAGSGYTQGDILTLTDGDGNATVTVTSVDGGGAITGISVLAVGTGYQYSSVSATEGGTGDQAATVSVNSVATYSPYSDDVPYDGYDIRSARAIIDSALNEINKTESQTLTDEFAFQQIDNCQTEVIQDLKRWSFMQLFDQTVGHTATGSWKFTLPDNIGTDNSNKSVYQLRVGTQQRLIWVDKQKFDEFLVGVAYTTLAAPALNGDSTLTLVDSSSFNSLASMSLGSGTVTIGANTYNYTANDTSTGVLTLESSITPSTTAPLGADVFQGATQGLPNFWTTYGGVGYYWPIASQSYNGFQLLMDYYTKQLKITSDSDILVLPDPTVVIYYLCWKFLKKLANGSETPDSSSYRDQYLSRKEKMRQKEVMNRTFKFKPRIQNFAVQSEFNESTPRWVRDAEFPNTGF
jgi:hypothetical protein